MKQIFVLSLVLLLATNVLPVSAAPADQLVNAPDQLAYIDAQVDVFLPHLAAFESNYLAVHGQYYQGLQSHSTAPDTITPPDGLDDHPTYQNDDLGVLWEAAALPWEIGWAFSVSTYDGPEGKGYVLTISTVIEGVTYQRAVNVGPETYRAADWYEVTPEF